MIRVLCVGKIKEKFFREALDEYQKRISRYTDIQIIETLEVTTSDVEKNINQEADDILKHLSPRDYVITMEIDGKPYNSIEFANKISKLFLTTSNLVFIIGGSDGLSLKVKERANEKISFSKMTYPHQLFRILLLEQIYRAFKINNNETYHK